MKGVRQMKNRGLLFIIIYLSALCVSLSQLKIVPLLGDIAGTLGISFTQTSWLMSIFTLAGIILAIPGASILGKFGPKKLFMMLMAALVVGNGLGAVSSSYGLLIVSRAIEGIAFAMVIMVGIVLIGQWFTDGKAGLAVGIYTTFPSLGNVIAMNTALPIANQFGQKSVWIVVAVLSALCFVLLAAVLKNDQPQPDADGPKAPQVSYKEALTNGKVWVLSLGQMCVGFVLFTFITIYPTLFTGLYGLDVTTSNFYAGLFGFFSIPFCILSGFLIDKVGNAPRITLVAFLGLAVTCFLTPMLSQNTYILHTLFAAMFTGLIIPAILYIAPGVTSKPALIGYSIALVNLMYYVGIFFGVPIVMNTSAASGWSAASYILTGVSLFGAVLFIIFPGMAKKSQS